MFIKFRAKRETQERCNGKFRVECCMERYNCINKNYPILLHWNLRFVHYCTNHCAVIRSLIVHASILQLILLNKPQLYNIFYWVSAFVLTIFLNIEILHLIFFFIIRNIYIFQIFRNIPCWWISFSLLI